MILAFKVVLLIALYKIAFSITVFICSYCICMLPFECQILSIFQIENILFLENVANTCNLFVPVNFKITIRIHLHYH